MSPDERREHGEHGDHGEHGESFDHPTVVLCPDGGPMLLRGASSVRDDEGRVHPVERPVVAVCRCGKSSRKPWCDGTHKVVRRTT